MRFSKRKLHFLFFRFLCWRPRNRKKKKMKKAKKPYKNRFFLRWSCKNVKNKKKMDFLQKLVDTICVRKGEKTRIFVHIICFGQKIFWPKTV